MGAHITRDLRFCLGHAGGVGSTGVKKGIVAGSAPSPSLTGWYGRCPWGQHPLVVRARG